MADRTKIILTWTMAGGLVVVAAALAISRVREWGTTGDQGLRVWFYDQSEQRLYTVPSDTLPPHVGIGGLRDDGVRAVVVAGPGEQGDAAKRRIAYLETYTPALRKVLDDRYVARTTGKPVAESAPPGDGEFIQENTLVRRPTETGWHAVASAEGQAIMAEWRNWRGAGGEALVVCVP